MQSGTFIFDHYRKTRFIALVSFLMLFWMASAFAEKPNPERDHEGKMALFKELNLSDQQKAEMKKIHEQNHDAMKEKREAVKQAKDQLKNAMDSNADDSKLRSYFNALQKAQNSAGEQRFEKALAIRKILTPEQRQKFRELKKKFGEEKKGGWKEGHGGWGE